MLCPPTAKNKTVLKIIHLACTGLAGYGPGRWGQTLTLGLNRPPNEASSMVNFRDRS